MEEINKLYTNPALPGSFSGMSGFIKANKNLNKSDVISYLKENEAYTLHKPKRKNFNRKRVIIPRIDHTWQLDLMDVQKISDENDMYRYLLAAIDCFSKKAWVIKMKNKTGQSTVEAFNEILKTSNRKPIKIQVDNGSEFYNKDFKELCKKNNIQLYSTYSELKASIVERFNRTIREKLQRYFTYADNNRYIEVLDDIVQSYNNSYHRSIKTSPNSVNKDNEAKIFLQLYKYNKKEGDLTEIDLKFKIGDKVRISKSKSLFQKGYEQNWTFEFFFIEKIIPSHPPTYILKDIAGEELSGTFYDKELQKVEQKEEVYRIEKILKTKTYKKEKLYLIKWLGWPDKFNSWEPASNLKK
jgi:transposase InsO family protein